MMTGKKEVIIIQTGIANTASVIAGLNRAGANARLSSSAAEISDAQYLLLPGVGAFAAGMKMLLQNELVSAIRKRVELGKPTMATCLGLQLLCLTSEESPGIPGLGIIPVAVSRFPSTVRVPQLGWNYIQPEAECRLLEPGYAYFANSFRLGEAPLGWNCAFAEHGGRFVAAIESGPVLACQFHAELSGSWGVSLLKRWLELC